MALRRGTTAQKGAKERLAARVALLAALAALTVFLGTSYSLKLWSDPVQWYCFGRDFPAQFGKAKLAYGFPLLLHLVIGSLGPLPAFLVNLPLLVLMALMLAAFTRSIFRESDREVRSLAPAAAILLLLVVNRGILPVLVSPYRDPFSFIFLLASLLLFRQGMLPPGRYRYALLSGVSLALAVSTRDTSVLAIPALGAAAACCRRIPRSVLPRWLLWWAAGFAVASLPYLYQNTLVSGFPWIPAQAARTLEEKFSLVPGVSPSFLHHTLPRVIAYLRKHYSWWGLLLGGIGALLLGRRERPALVLIGCLFALYLLFYGSYVYPVKRYLMVLDLFMLPLMAGGLVKFALVAVQLTGGRDGWHKAAAGIVSAGLLCLALAAVVARNVPGTQARTRFRLQDARRLQALLHRHIPPQATLVSGRYFGEVALCLITNPVVITDFIAPAHTPWHFNLPAILAAQLHGRTTVMAALTSASLAEMLAGEYDLRPVTTIDLDREKFPLPLKRRQIPLVELLPWSNRTVSLTVENRGPPGCLQVDLGRVSRLPRTRLMLELDGRLLDADPSDYLNYYRIDSTNAALRLTVRSDRPLPAGIRAEVRPFPLSMSTAFHGLRLLESILSAPARRYPRWKYSAVCDTTGLRLPALARDEEYLLTGLTVGVPSWIRSSGPRLTISSGPNTLLSVDLAEASDGRSPWTQLFFAVPPPSPSSPIPRHVPVDLALSLTGHAADDKPPCIFLKRVQIMPVIECPQVMDVGGPDDHLWLRCGFHHRECGRYGNEQFSWRWTSSKAEVLVLTRRPSIALAIEIDELAELRPGTNGAAFAFNDRPVGALVRRRLENGPLVITHRITVQAQAVTGRVNRLTIFSPPWSPRDEWGGADTRTLGMAVDEIRIRSRPP